MEAVPSLRFPSSTQCQKKTGGGGMRWIQERKGKMASNTRLLTGKPLTSWQKVFTLNKKEEKTQQSGQRFLEEGGLKTILFGLWIVGYGRSSKSGTFHVRVQKKPTLKKRNP